MAGKHKTVKDAQKWAEKNMVGRHQYVKSDVKFRGRSSADYGVFNYKRLSIEQANAINKVINEANTHSDKIGIPRLRGLKARIYAPSASADYADGVMAMNKKSFNPIGNSPKNVKYQEYLNDWKKTESARIAAGKKPRTTASYFMHDSIKTGEARFWHEYGHHIDAQKKLGAEIKLYLNDLTKKVFREKTLPSNTKVFISNYFPSRGASTEWFAEAYCLYKMGLVNKLPHGFVDFLKKHGID